MTIDRADHQLIQTTTFYQPGEYSFSFQLKIPTDIVTNDTSKLPPHNLTLEYHLVASAQSTGLWSRKKEWKQRLTVRRVHAEQSSSASSLFRVKREDKFECSVYAPKFSPLGHDCSLGVYLHALSQGNRVQRIDVQLIQTYWVNMMANSNVPDQRGKRFL